MNRLTLINRSGYDYRDLYRFFIKGINATGIRKSIRIVVVAAPQRSRGCAEVGGRDMVIAISSPAHFSLRRLSRLFEHEAAHINGRDHGKMSRKLLFSLGPIPNWAKDCKIRYNKRAPNQLQFLRHKNYDKS